MHAELVITGDWILLRDPYAGDLEGTPETALIASKSPRDAAGLGMALSEPRLGTARQ